MRGKKNPKWIGYIYVLDIKLKTIQKFETYKSIFEFYKKQNIRIDVNFITKYKFNNIEDLNLARVYKNYKFLISKNENINIIGYS